MRQPGWDESTEASDRSPAPPPWQTGLVEPGGGPQQQPLPPAGWRPVATGRRASVWTPARREVLLGLGVVAVLAATGLGIAAIWLAVAPRLAFKVVAPGNGVPVVPEGEQFVAADGWYALLTFAVGVLAAVLVWRLRSVRGPTAVAALAVGALCGALVTWRFGLVLAPAPRPDTLGQVGRVIYPALRLRALSALMLEPIAAVGTYLIFAGFAARNDLGRADPPPEPDPGIS